MSETDNLPNGDVIPATEYLCGAGCPFGFVWTGRKLWSVRHDHGPAQALMMPVVGFQVRYQRKGRDA